jgi:hypothetical protein
MIKVAVDILDHFKERLDEMGQDIEVEAMPKEILDKINENYRAVLSKKILMIKQLKDFQTSMTKQIDSIDLPDLQLYLAPRYASADNRIYCECGYSSNTKQGMSAHKRHCKKA